ncbi:single-stranded DNA exonuclease [Sulfolobus tengchongensis]|uniref:Single-stranded DNA exonuclease n=1 Tax=Sulfolobus tengchongensis TaxID=207809 RepID=A0AAX4KZV1_9CREN
MVKRNSKEIVMEVFLGEPNNQEIREVVRNLYLKDYLCISTYYSLEPLLFSYIISKNIKNAFMISYQSEECEIQLKFDANGKWIIDNKNKKRYFLGQNSYCSYLSINTDDILPIVSCILTSMTIDRRSLSEWELSMLKELEKFGLFFEKNLRIPGYKHLPLFLSLMFSLDPYIPNITGNRENTLNLIKEINANEISKLEDLNENQLNTLLFKIISAIVKENPKFTRDDIIADRIFYLDYDLLELTFALIYSFDTIGSTELMQLGLSSSYAEILINRFRQTFSKGFSVNLVDTKQTYYIIEVTNFNSPLLAQLILLQLQKIRRDKIIVLKERDKLYTSRYFLPQLKKEGLIQIDDRTKALVGM